jgi:hypothetical protein
VAICCALAAALHLGLTEYATQTTVTYCDGGTAETRGPISEPIIPGSGTISDTFCMFPAKDGHRTVAAFYDQSGVFPRGKTPSSIAIGMGIIFPILLVCLAGYFGFDATRGRIRAGLAICFLLTGLILSAPLFIISYDAWRGHYDLWRLLQDRLAIRAICLFTVPAALLLSGGLWLWRTRSNKEPA